MNYPPKGNKVILQTSSVAFFGILEDAYMGLTTLSPLKNPVTPDYLIELEKDLGISPIVITRNHHFIMPSPASYILIDLDSKQVNPIITTKPSKK